MYPDVKLHIGGEWRQGSSAQTIPVQNPASNEEIGRVAVASREDLDRAADSAAYGFQIWESTPAVERSRIIRRAAGLVRERAPRIARLLTLEQGKPLAEAEIEVNSGAEIIEWFAEEAYRTYGRVIPSRDAGGQQMTLRRPIGPIAAFTPWNFPVGQVVRKVAAALAAGCSVVLKASEEAPASPAEIIQAFADAGLPSGVLNLVYGNPDEISSHLIACPAIKKISFTGSTAVGRHLSRLAGAQMKMATMELGGHAPVIVSGSSDIGKAARTLASAKFRNAGQICAAPTRFLVESACFDEFIRHFVDQASAIKVSDGCEPGCMMGPLANERRVSAMQSFVKDAVDQGAELRLGGARIGNRGNFFQPTVLVNIPKTAKVMNEEPFGPIALVNAFDRFEDAVAEANRLPYGLAAYAFTDSLEISAALIDRVECGAMSINQVKLGLPETPFGGVKDSGYGREGGEEGMEEYMTTKYVAIYPCDLALAQRLA